MMSDALENKAVKILDKSQAAIATFADKLAWLWVGVFEPKLWVAKKVLGL